MPPCCLFVNSVSLAKAIAYVNGCFNWLILIYVESEAHTDLEALYTQNLSGPLTEANRVPDLRECVSEHPFHAFG